MTKWGGSWDRPSVAIKRLENLLDEFQEEFTKAVRTITTEKAYIHDGVAYQAVIGVDSFDVENVRFYTIKTPSDKNIHINDIILQAIGGSVTMCLMRGTDESPIVFTDTEGVVNDGSSNENIVGHTI